MSGTALTYGILPCAEALNADMYRELVDLVESRALSLQHLDRS